ncbi:MAG: discoidin domain-containing protein, partial [Candidatus Latescibacteria bacterium]|nr:discoidin domain-containing protein [Candidatus Latescibacterota bacterium]
MRTTTCRRFSGLLLCMAVGIAGVGHGSALGEPLQNIALGKPYTMLNAGKYPACTDDGDRTDLTDGEIHDGESLWTQKGTVGFSARRDMWITVDLGKVEPIVGAALHTGAGAASVMWPISLSVRVSDDGKAFALAGDLVRMHEGDLPRAYQGYVSHTYRTTELRTRGRYVRFEILVPGEFAFADEVEVYRGDRGLLVAPAGGPPVASEQIKDPDRLTRMGCYRRIRSDLENVRALVRHASPEDADSLIARLDRVQAKLEESRFPADVASFRAIVPFNNLHAEVFRVYSRLLPPRGESGISLWHTPRYRMLSMFEEPGEAVSELTITMGQNERRAEVLNVTNTSDRAGTLRFGIVGLPGGTNPDYIRPHQVEYVDGREGEVIASALVPLEQRDGSYETAIASGMTR